MKKILSLVLLSTLFLVGSVSAAEELVLAEKGKGITQIVIPDATVTGPVVDRWLAGTAALMKEALVKNGMDAVVKYEKDADTGAPSIYLGDTQFAEKNGVKEEFSDWSYIWKTVGKDLVIRGTDKEDTKVDFGEKPRMPNLALLGSVKGGLDFLREYMHAPILFFNHQTNTDILRNKNEPNDFFSKGGMSLDTRSIAFGKMDRLAIPSDLNLKHTPKMRGRQIDENNPQSFYGIAMNLFPNLRITSTMEDQLFWEKVVPLKKYGKSHPDYFALLPNGKRAPEQIAGPHPQEYTAITNLNQVALNPMSPGMRNLMVEAAEELIQKGSKLILIRPLDSYLLMRCNCDDCNTFFGMGAMTEEEVHARSETGKLWEFYFMITEEIRKKYPDVRIALWEYRGNPLDPKVIQQVPENVVAQFKWRLPNDFDILDGISTPAGLKGKDETFTGFGFDGKFMAERTPETAVKNVRAMVDHNVQWITRDGRIGYVRGIQAPAYYVYGRMLDNPDADWEEIESEFYKAAFGNVASQMESFFHLLHNQIEIYSDIALNWNLLEPFGGKIKSDRFGRRRAYYNAHSNSWHHRSIYTADFIQKAEALLSKAEKSAKDEDVKARLALIRTEFDYAKKLGELFAMEEAWKVHPTDDLFQAIIDKVDDWREEIKEVTHGVGRHRAGASEAWPEMLRFDGYTYENITLQRPSYQNDRWMATSLGWDTKAIRDGALNQEPVFKVYPTKGVPDLHSEQWNTAKPIYLYDHGNLPQILSRTTVKGLYDSKNLYLLFTSTTGRSEGMRYLASRMKAPKNEKEALVPEYAEVLLGSPDGKGIYRLITTPSQGEVYDAVFHPQEDLSWKGSWTSTYVLKDLETMDDEEDFGWSMLFTIPFSDLGVTNAKPGLEIPFNVGRQYKYEATYHLMNFISWIKKGKDEVSEDAMGKLILMSESGS